MSDYQLDNRWPKARHRLELLCEAGDPQSIEALRATGIGPGWRCLEVGGGLGTLARWMAAEVGPEGRVMATDIETHFLDELGDPRVEVLRHDITCDPLEAGSFDLIHARAVLMHLPDPQAVLARLVAALRPGGWLVVEEPDFSADGPDELGVAPEAQALYSRIKGEILSALEQRGLHFGLGRSLWGSLARHGLTDTVGFGRTQLVVGGSRQSAFEVLTYEQLLASVAPGTPEERARFLALFSDPGFAYFREMLVSAAGRKPARSR